MFPSKFGQADSNCLKLSQAERGGIGGFEWLQADTGGSKVLKIYQRCFGFINTQLKRVSSVENIRTCLEMTKSPRWG